MKRISAMLGDSTLIGALAFLILLSTITLISFATSPELDVSTTTIYKHFLAIGLGIGCILGLKEIDYRTLRGMSRPLYLVVVIMMVLVLLVGETIQGSTRWFQLFGVSFQPIELAKIVVIILMAKYMAIYHTHLSSFTYIMYSAIPVAILSGLTMLQPDLGSAVLLIVVWFVMLIIARIRVRHMIYLFAGTLVLAGILWGGYLEPYQKERIYTFLQPYSDPLGSGYNTIQALRAIEQGGVYGQGLSQGDRLQYIPEVHTDFIFAGFAQQWGSIGISLYFFAMSLIIWRLTMIAWQARDVFAQMLVGGVLALFVTQAAVNLGMNLGLLPITGLPLPFMSYGGSSLMSFAILFGIVLSVHRQLTQTGSHVSDRSSLYEIG